MKVMWKLSVMPGPPDEALEAVKILKPNVVLMDIGLPDMSGIDATREIKRTNPEVAVVALTIHEDEEYFFKMLEAGAGGYVPKRAAPEELLTAIRAAAAGEVYLYPSLAKLLVKDYLTQEHTSEGGKALDGLTEREQEVLRYLAEGMANEDIANALVISRKDGGTPSREYHAETWPAFPLGIGTICHPKGNYQTIDKAQDATEKPAGIPGRLFIWGNSTQ